jgi:hypothetical protein
MQAQQPQESAMKTLLIAGVAAAALGLAAPASAQVGVGVDHGGVGVQVGPFGAGVGPAYGWGHRRYHEPYAAYGYARECRTVRERVMTPSGRMITRSQRICD